MPELRSEHGAILLGRSAPPVPDLSLELKFGRAQRTRAWSSFAVDKLISCVAIAVLAPAILAVWIAIKRSAPTVASDSTSLKVVPAKAPILLTIKPLRISVPQKIDNLKIAANRAISA